MPGKSDLAPGYLRFEFRSGVNDFRWKGINSEGDPSSIPPNTVRMAINARIIGSEFIERPGLTKLNSAPLNAADAVIQDIVPYDPPRPYRLWTTSQGCPGLSAGFGFSLGNLDQEQDPEFQRVVYYDTAATTCVLATFGGDMYVGVDSALRKLQLIKQPWGTESISVSGSSQDTPVVTFSGFTISCMQQFNGKLFIGLNGGAGASKVVVWDGTSVRDDKTAIDAPVAFALYRVQNGGDALVMSTATTNNLYIRSTGDAPGTWTTPGTVVGVSMISYKDVLYIATGGVNVSSWNGTAITAAAHAPASGVAVNAVVVFNGFLYFAYTTAASVRIGKYDGTTWTDVEKNLTTQFTGTNGVRAMADYRNYLAVAGTKSGVGFIWLSNLTDTSGTYTEIQPNVASNGVVSALLAA